MAAFYNPVRPRSSARPQFVDFAPFYSYSARLPLSGRIRDSRGKLAHETRTGVGSRLTRAVTAQKEDPMRWFRKMLNRLRFPIPTASFG
jgi:hypothetical protein